MEVCVFDCNSSSETIPVLSQLERKKMFSFLFFFLMVFKRTKDLAAAFQIGSKSLFQR